MCAARAHVLRGGSRDRELTARVTSCDVISRSRDCILSAVCLVGAHMRQRELSKY